MKLLSIAVLLLSVTPQAAAEPGPQDHRPCVSLREFAGSPWFAKKYDLETRWDVHGLGVRSPNPENPRHFDVTYPACGFSLDEAWVIVSYANNRRWHEMWRWRTADATLHGENRSAASPR